MPNGCQLAARAFARAALPERQLTPSCCAPIAPPADLQDVLKPGGGLGVVVPNWRYTWDARKDGTEWGHRWNSAPEVVCRLHLKYWSHLADLEQLNTLKCKIGMRAPVAVAWHRVLAVEDGS